MDDSVISQINEIEPIIESLPVVTKSKKSSSHIAAPEPIAPAPVAITDPLELIMANVDLAYDQAAQLVDSLRDQLEDAVKKLNTLEAFRSIKNGTFHPQLPTNAPRFQLNANNTRAPRGSVQAELLDILAKSSDGLDRAGVISKMEAHGDKSKEASISNALASLKKTGKIDYNNGLYRPL